jgi:hypothetical protein
MAESKPKSRSVTEYVLQQRLPGGKTQGVFSHADPDVVAHRKVRAQLDEGMADLEVVKRVASYPLDESGRDMHGQSTVAETVL